MDWLRQLRMLRHAPLESGVDLSTWNANAVALLRSGAPLPEIAIHYLNDADIRLEDSRYREVQDAAFDEWLEAQAGL